MSNVCRQHLHAWACVCVCGCGCLWAECAVCVVVSFCVCVCACTHVFVLHIDNFINAVTFSIKYAQRRKHSCTIAHTELARRPRLPHLPRPAHPCSAQSINPQ